MYWKMGENKFMGSKEKIIIHCMDCEKDGLFDMWSDINAEKDPIQKEDLLSGKIYQYTCPHCRSTRFVDHGMLYHAPERELMVQCVMQDFEEKLAIRTFKEIQDGSLGQEYELGTGYKLRVVRSLTRLREKALIFENDLDDRVIELMKHNLLEKISEASPDTKIEDIQLDFPEPSAPRFLLKFPENQMGYITFDPRLYGKIKKKMRKHPAGKCEFVVDQEWAGRMHAEE